MPYAHYTLEEFLTDTDFIRWAKSPDEESNAFWDAYMSQHLEQADIIQQARRIILQFEIQDKKISPNKYLQLWENISQATVTDAIKLTQPNRVNHMTPLVARLGGGWFFKIAASITLITLCALFYIRYQYYKAVTLSTNYGESRTLFLPDSTKVTLNSNSRITYVESDFHKSSRQVTLEGQAFFAVTHTIDNQNFRVQTSELQVEVLGTRFDVNSRRGTTQVVLEEGKVRVDVEGNNITGNAVVMKPGDLAKVSGDNHEINVKNVNTSSYLAWRNNKLEFDGALLTEIAQVLEDNYGYKVNFADSSLMTRKFSGSSPGDDVPELLNTLSRIFSIRVNQKGKEISFDKL